MFVMGRPGPRQSAANGLSSDCAGNNTVAGSVEVESSATLLVRLDLPGVAPACPRGACGPTQLCPMTKDLQKGRQIIKHAQG